MADFHGIQIDERLAGVRSVNAPPTAVVGVIGTAPNFLTGAKADGKLALVTNAKTAAAFGPDLPGYTIPNALNAILEYCSPRIVVIDVFNPDKHKSSVADEVVTLDDRGNASLTHMGIISAVVKYNGDALLEGTDYKLDKAYGTLERIKAGALEPKAELKIDYEYGDPSLVTSQDIIGAVDEAGFRSGIQAFVDSATRLGYMPRILLAPGYTFGTSVATKLLAMADKIHAIAYLDVPVGATVKQCIEGRGPDGEINLGTSSDRAVLCYPQVEVIDPRTDQKVFEPLSQNLAGLACYVDMTEGFFVSPSNHELRRVIGIETPVGWSIDDPNCEAAMLNEVGIVTVVHPYGEGFKMWGNRTASFPSETHPICNISVRTVADYMHEVILRALRRYMDQPMDKPVLGFAREDVLAALENLKRQKAIIGSSFTWPEDENPISEMSAGHVFYELSFLPPIPINRITVRKSIDTTWLKNLYGTA
jgi:phage tail sheath protein FI